MGLAACELGGARWLVDLAVTRWRGMVPVAYLSFWLLCSGSFSSNLFLYLYRSKLGSRLTAAEGWAGVEARGDSLGEVGVWC